MTRLARLVVRRYVNGGTVLVLMGILWLYLWVFPWYPAYLSDPRWGHNYTESIAFLSSGLAYFNRRTLSYSLAFLAAALVIPASLELLPQNIIALVAAGILTLIVLDILVERRRPRELLHPYNPIFHWWLKRHLPRFSYLLLAHIAFLYFFVRLPSGTYETDFTTKVYDGLLIPFIIIVLMEDMPAITNPGRMKRLAFLWGLSTMAVSLVTLLSQQETWPVLGITCLALTLGITTLALARKKSARVID